ncbi:MAG: hypothetical protein AAFQ08_00985 [Bacteroidota bacterium]
MTAFYSFRLIRLAFMQEPSCGRPTSESAHEPGPAMLLPMGLLCIGSISSGYLFRDMFIGTGSCAFTGPIFVSPENAFEFGAEFCPFTIKILPLVFSLSGTVLALVLYTSYGRAVSIF